MMMTIILAVVQLLLIIKNSLSSRKVVDSFTNLLIKSKLNVILSN